MIMHGNKLRGLGWSCTLCFLPILFFFFVNCQFPYALGSEIRFMSTSTGTPEILTTPKNSDSNKMAIKAEVVNFVNLAMSLENLKLAEDMLTNSSVIQEMEEKLRGMLDIVLTMEHFYGFKSSQESTMKCAFEYPQTKAVLLQELSILLKDCRENMDNVDVLHLINTENVEMHILHACSERAKTIPLDVVRLLDQVYQRSSLCAVENVRNLLKEMTASNMLESIEENSSLMVQELEYLLRTYENIVENLPPGENRSKAENLLKGRKTELATFKQIAERNITKNSLRIFQNELDNALNHHQTSTESSEDLSLLKLGKSIKEVVFENHLQIPALDTRDNSIESWAMTPGVYKIVFLHRLLKETITNMTLIIPKSKETKKAQQDYCDNVELFTEISHTLGKPCENSANHLVGTCTAENNEICRHVVANWGAEGDQELLPNEELKLLENVEIKHCTCGFRTNCGESHATRRNTCFLIPNDKGQCRGGLGYPCGTYPLARGEYDESCISGYCNRKKDSCEVNKSPPFAWSQITGLKKVVKKKLGSLVKMFG